MFYSKSKRNTMDNLPKSAGHISEVTVERERVKLTPGKSDDDYRLTLTRLRRLSQIVMSRTVRRRFEARKLYRSNIIKYLEKNLTNSSKKVRYLALQLLYSTIPRLGNKTDSLLEPLLPKIFQCLQEIEGKDMNLLAIHFLRGYFRHTKDPTRFIENYVRLGIENSDHHIQISCCFGLNIIFDQDTQNSIFSQIVVPVMNLLIQGNHHQLTRVVYHSLKQIQNVVGEDRFFIITSNADPTAIEMFRKSCIFEESDPFLTFNDNNYNSLVSEYRVKRKASDVKKDFGIFDPTLLDRIQKTSHCKRAGAMSNFAVALKLTSWKKEDLLPHMMDFLKFINASVTDTNRLVQVSGLKILEELINIMGFILSPHIHWIVEILLQELTSANIKVRSMGRKVLHKLMRNVHPMTVTWELLRTKNDSLKIVALIVSQDALSNFLYHEIDLINLCNYLGQSVEDENPDLANCSRDFIVSLLDVMRECPVYGIRKEAVRILLESNKLQEDTLRDIGVFKYSKKEEFQEGFEFQSSSDDETTDYDTSNNPPGTASTGISMAMSQTSISTAGEYESVYRDSYLGFVEESKSVQRSTLNSKCKSTNSESIEETWKQFGTDSNTELHSPEYIRSPIEGQNEVTQATGRNSLVESSETSSIKESILFSETDSISSRSFSRALEENIPQLGDSKQNRNDSAITPKSLESSQMWKKIEKSAIDTSSDIKRTHSTSRRDDASPCKELIQTKKMNPRFSNATTQNSKVFASKNIYGQLKPNSRYKPKKYATPFSVKKDVKRSEDSERHSSQNIHAAGDAESISETSLVNVQEEPEIEINPRHVREKTVEMKEVSSIGTNNQCEESEKSFRKSIDKTTSLNRTETKSCNTGKHSSPSKWAGCQWKRDLEYASKAGTCPWAENFEKEVKNMKPFQPNEVDNEMRKALEYLEGESWKKKEEAMMRVLRVAKTHPELIQENTSKIVFVLSTEIRNFRQSVAGKAILTTGHLYEIMGRNFESNIRLAVGALLAKSGNRTLAAYFRLVIKSLFKITNSTSPQKIVMIFILQGSKLSNKYARETAAQFIAILTERLGPENSLTSSLSSPMLKCAASFVTDSSALTRYCGKRMFKVFMKHREFEKLKYNHIDINTLNFIANILVQIKEKGITEEILPINVID